MNFTRRVKPLEAAFKVLIPGSFQVKYAMGSLWPKEAKRYCFPS